MKKKVMLMICLLTSVTIYACPVCEKQQPKVLRGITHGAGPQSNWDWVIVGLMVVLTIVVLAYSILYLIRPNEDAESHIKNNILRSF